MDRIALLPDLQRADIFREASRLKRMTPATIEKDFWVCWVLGKVFGSASLSQRLLFKGGTSLSKAYKLIERFSEDIDLILDWRVVTAEEPAAPRSRTRQACLNIEIQNEARNYIRQTLLGDFRDLFGGVVSVAVNSVDPDVIDVTYPRSFDDSYFRPEIRLEIGPLADWVPNEERQICPFAAEVIPEAFGAPACGVRLIKAQRTFWEKATILHHEAHRPEDSHMPARYSRHYYDMAMMARSQVRTLALLDIELLASVVASKDRFYPRGWARYDLAVPGTLVLEPPPHVKKDLSSDYRRMKPMIWGTIPHLDEILATIRDLQDEINGRR